MSIFSDKHIKEMIHGARLAGESLRGHQARLGELNIQNKSNSDFVSEADLTSEKIIKEYLSSIFPDYGFLAEESGATATEDPSGKRWVIDPLDGTTNFLHNHPHYAVSIGLEDESGILAGVVYDVAKDEMFVAGKGMGAFMNGNPIKVSGLEDLAPSLSAVGLPFQGRDDTELTTLQLFPLMEKTAGIRRNGAAALDLAWVACGRFDMYWENKIYPWDILAGILLVREAGGIVTDISGGNKMGYEFGILSGTPKIHKQIYKEFQQISKNIKKDKK